MDMSFVAVAAAASHIATGRWLLRAIVAVNGDAHSAAQVAIVADKEPRRSIFLKEKESLLEITGNRSQYETQS
jgi:hypothetical protein